MRRDVTPKLNSSVPTTAKEDESVFDLIAIPKEGNRQKAYDCYVTLLHEYMREKAPSSIEIGKVKFTRGRIKSDVVNTIHEFAKRKLIRRDIYQLHEHQGKALLAKSLYERGILSYLASENELSVDDDVAFLNKVAFGSYKMTDHLNNCMSGDVNAICKKFKDDALIRELISSKGTKLINSTVKVACDKYQKLYDAFANA